MTLVIAEQRDGALSASTWEAVAAARQLSAGAPVSVAVVGKGIDRLAAELSVALDGSVLAVDHDLLAIYTSDGFTAALAQIVQATAAQHVVLAHTYQARDFAPRLAERLGATLITDVTSISGSGADATFKRPMFQGKMIAQVRPCGQRPVIVTVQAGAFEAVRPTGAGGAAVVRMAVQLDQSSIRQQSEPPFRGAAQTVDLARANRIVAVGRGIKDPQYLPIAFDLARSLGAEIAASRPVCDAGWLPPDRQVGSSGQTVAPDLYVAVGIAGAIQHLVGMRGSRTIVAINKDPDAPVFEVADYGVVADLIEFLPAFTAALAKA